MINIIKVAHMNHILGRPISEVIQKHYVRNRLELLKFDPLKPEIFNLHPHSNGRKSHWF